MVELKILSHACALIKTDKHAVVIDPWLIGSCYWRSWWNYPQVELDVPELAAVDAVVISHIHWDHWHGPSLKRFFKGKRIIIPDEPGLRSENDLRAIGFENIVRVPHAGSVDVGDIRLTLYQFGLYLNDAAVVAEAQGVKILDANDAKIAGAALGQITRRHGRFDFAMRSHSSANARVCFRVRGETLSDVDDREHYFRSYVAFMNKVQPRYAVPFASNHCHLHDDVYALNSYVSNPVELGRYIEAQHVEHKSGWSFAPMLPGSSWSSVGGFRFRNADCFENLDARISAYRAQVADRLDAYSRQESAIVVSDALLQRFTAMLPRKARGQAVPASFVLTVRWPDGRARSWAIDLSSQQATACDAPQLDSAPGQPVMVLPAIVFRDAVVKNMFHHAVISKRCAFRADSAADMEVIHHVMTELDRRELGVRPLSLRYARRMVAAYVGRWRELLVYAHAVWLMKIRRKPVFLAEEAILRDEF
jgi:UDP-MurNAc hydroxylase